MSRWVKNLFLVAAVAVTAVSHAYSLQDATIKIDHAVNSPTLSVKYAGMKASLIELKVNTKSKNSKVVSPDDNFGELAFPIDLDSLDDGDNLVEIIIYDTNGKVLGVQRTSIKVDRNSDGPVYMQGLKSGASVQGTIELKLGVNKDFRDLYVSFFVDEDWKGLKNTQPYTYNWDTTRQTNGWHVVQAWVVDEQNNTFKTKKVKVYVNNPGGRTERIENPATTSTTNPKPDPAGQGGVVAVVTTPKISVKPDMKFMPVTGIMGSPSTFRTQSVSGGTAAGQKNLTPTGKRLAPKTVVLTPVKTTTVPVAPVAVTSVKVYVAPKASTNVAPKAPTKVAVLPKATAAVAPVALVAPKQPVITLSYGSRLPDVGTFNLSWNAKKIVFDAVQPRVQDGIPLTPFRFLLEQSGGKVGWAAKTKEVSASGSGRDIHFQIGKKNAMVNKLPVKLEIAPFIDRSRAVVPLSFIQAALNVVVDYDPNTGHVLITAPKK
ncbi:MAG: hypothetical protein K8R88_13605 [Armatimonadetes bacterium]|nr:hypothetical protein [Armatimonadota bacterium]